MRWFEPDEDLSDSVALSGDCGAAIATMAKGLEHVERFLAAGIDPPTRVLFSGPSGTGKTLTARWLGWKLKLPVAITDISQVVASHLGETSTNIGACFRAAVREPSILFLDEIDAICAKRESTGSSAAGLELARATSTMLQQIDWLAPGAIVIAATNYRNLLDPALLRRLSSEVVFEVPDRDARLRMLQHWLGRSPLAGAALERLADESDGLSGAALRARAMAEGRKAVLEQAGREPKKPVGKMGPQCVLEALSEIVS